MKKQLQKFIISFCLLSISGKAQVNFDWVNQIGDISQTNIFQHDVVSKVQIFNNAVYVTGTFLGTVDFDPGAGSLIYSTANPYSIAPYIVKYDMNGGLIWAKIIEYNSGPGDADILDFTINSNEEIILAGKFYGTIDVDPSSAVNTLTTGSSTLYPGVFILKLDKNGNFIDAKSFFSSVASDDIGYTIQIALDNNQNIIITGLYTGTYDFDFSTNNFSLSGTGVYIAKYDNLFNFIWAKPLNWTNGLYYFIPNQIKINSNDEICLSGYFDKGTVDFDPSTSNFNITALPNQIASFLCKYDANGSFIWAFKLDGDINSFDIDNTHNIYVVGDFKDSIDVDPTNGVNKIKANLNCRDMFIAKYNTSGNLLWVKEMDVMSSGYIFPLQIKVDNIGNIYSFGNYSNTADFDPASNNNTNTIPIFSWSNIFVSKLNPNGDFIFVEKHGSNADIYPITLSINNSGDIIMGGSFKNTCFFSPSSTSVSLNAISGADAYILKWKQSLTGIYSNSDSQNSVVIYPNPGNGQFIFNGLEKESNIQIYDVAGRLIYQAVSQNIFTTIDMSAKAKGVYFYKIINDKKEIQQGKLLIQ